jgi:hypothetical protein
MGRVQSDRRHQRRHLVAKIAPHPQLLLVRPLVAPHDADTMRHQLGQDALVEDAVLPLDLSVGDFADFGEHPPRGHAIRADQLVVQCNLPLQPGHAYLEKLIHVARKNKQELQPLQQRCALVQRLVQHADVELQLGKFTVDVQPAVRQIHCRGQRRIACRQRG